MLITEKSLSEISFRLKQLVWNKLDRFKYLHCCSASSPSGLGEPREGNLDFFPYYRPEAVGRTFEELPHAWQDTIREKANLICEKKFDLLGLKNISFPGKGQEINWHLDPIRKICAPVVWWQEVKYLDDNVVGDAKIPWELNRHQYLLTLAIAYQITKDKKYKECILEHLDSWFQTNLPKHGLNWTSSLELALRSIAWLWCLRFLSPIDDLSPQFLARLKHYLFLQADHVANNLSVYFSPNTHLTGEALGLFYVGLFFKDDRKGQEWITSARDILVETVEKHVLPDGGYVERSLWYHRYTLEIYLHFFLLSKHNRISIPPEIEAAILRMADFLLYSLLPSRKLPLIGDDDGGRLLPLDSLTGDDVRGLFSTLAVIFNREEYKFIANDFAEETFWLLGPDSKNIFDQLQVKEPLSSSKGFSETGYFFLRSGWSERDNYLAFDCAPHGWLNSGHAHADLLSFQVHHSNVPVVVDPGTYCYVGEWRNIFRGPDYHSLAKIDGHYPAEARGLFHWGEIPQHELIAWKTSGKLDYIAGLCESSRGWKHLREIFFIKPEIFVVVDTINGSGRHIIEMRFHLAGSDWSLEKQKCTHGSQKHISLSFYARHDIRLQLSEAWLSPCYGRKEPAMALLCRADTDLPAKLYSLINLSPAEHDVRFSQASEQSAFQVCNVKNNKTVFNYPEGKH